MSEQSQAVARIMLDMEIDESNNPSFVAIVKALNRAYQEGMNEASRIGMDMHQKGYEDGFQAANQYWLATQSLINKVLP